MAVADGLREARTKDLAGCVAPSYNRALPRGGIAQLGERLHGMQEVSGSIPLTSTTRTRQRTRIIVRTPVPFV